MRPVSPLHSGHIVRVLLSALFLFFILAAAPQVHARLLVGEVQHMESVEPVPDNLRPGSTFSKDSVPGLGYTGNTWYKIPEWLAGIWHKESQTDYYVYSYANNSMDSSVHKQVARSDGRWGMQKDDSGNVWQYDPLPYTQTIDAGTQSIVQVVRVCEPIELDGRRFAKRSVVTEIRTDKATAKIVSVQTGEEISYFIPQSDNLVKRETSSKVFDSNGQPILLGRSYSYENRLTWFQEQDFYLGKDMRVLFKQFLKMSGLTACLPGS
jgi:hypothetical protein